MLLKYRIASSVLGSYHQGGSKFGTSAGVQCACNSLLDWCWSTMPNVNQWQAFHLEQNLCEDNLIANGQTYLFFFKPMSYLVLFIRQMVMCFQLIYCYWKMAKPVHIFRIFHFLEACRMYLLRKVVYFDVSCKAYYCCHTFSWYLLSFWFTYLIKLFNVTRW